MTSEQNELCRNEFFDVEHSDSVFGLVFSVSSKHGRTEGGCCWKIWQLLSFKRRKLDWTGKCDCCSVLQSDTLEPNKTTFISCEFLYELCSLLTSVS